MLQNDEISINNSYIPYCILPLRQKPAVISLLQFCIDHLLEAIETPVRQEFAVYENRRRPADPCCAPVLHIFLDDALNGRIIHIFLKSIDVKVQLLRDVQELLIAQRTHILK